MIQQLLDILLLLGHSLFVNAISLSWHDINN